MAAFICKHSSDLRRSRRMSGGAQQNTEAAAQHLRRFAPRPLLLPGSGSPSISRFTRWFPVQRKVQTVLGQNSSGRSALDAGSGRKIYRKRVCLPIRFLDSSGTRPTAATSRQRAWRWMCLGKRDTRRPYAESARRRGRSGKGGGQILSGLSRPTARLEVARRRCFRAAFTWQYWRYSAKFFDLMAECRVEHVYPRHNFGRTGKYPELCGSIETGSGTIRFSAHSDL